MTPPPQLDIARYHVDSFAFTAHDDFDDERDSAGDLSVDFHIAERVGDPLSFRMTMDIRVAEAGYTAETNAPYSIALTIIGYFLFTEGTTEETKARMMNLNGASILYGIARGFVGQATGASRHGQFVLPAVNFIELLRQRQESKTPERRAVAAPAEAQTGT